MTVNAILVGSKASWQPKLEKQLLSYGIKVIGCWRNPADPGKTGIWKGTDLVLLTTDCASHSLQDAAVSVVRKTELPLIRINHRWASCRQMLETHGYTYSAMPPKNTKKETMRKTTGHDQETWLTLLRPLVMENPTISSNEVLATPPFAGVDEKNHPTMRRALTRLRAEAGLTGRGGAVKVADPAKLRKFQGLPPLLGPYAVALAAAPAQAAAPAPVSPPDQPVHPVHPGPAPLLDESTALPPDVQEALSLLLGEMREHGFTSMTLTSEGTVNHTRSVVVNGSSRI